MFLGGLLENLEAATGDVHLGAVGSEGLGVHQADAGAAARDEADPAVDVEELASLERFRAHHFVCLLWLCGSWVVGDVR